MLSLLGSSLSISLLVAYKPHLNSALSVFLWTTRKHLTNIFHLYTGTYTCKQAFFSLLVPVTGLGIVEDLPLKISFYIGSYSSNSLA